MNSELSPRELEVLKLIVLSNQNKTIADQLHLSIKTIEKHRQNVMKKTAIHDVAGLTRYAIREHIIEA